MRSSTTPWERSEALTRAPLDGNTTADVCVIGAGIAGLSVAYELQRDGRSVVVLEAARCGGGQTGRTTAHLASALDDGFVALERWHGADGARGAAASHAAAIDRIETIGRDEEIDCGFARIDGHLFAAGDDPDREQAALRDEHAAAARAGLEVEIVARAPLPSLDTGPCVRFARQGRIEPLRYVSGLARAIERRGGRIFGAARATTIAATPGHVETSGGHRVSAAAVVVATNAPVHSLLGVHPKQAPYTSYALALRVPRATAADVLLWDTADPYHYVRLLPDLGGDDELLVVGGEDHKTGHGDDGRDRHAQLEAWVRRRFPLAGAVVHRWSGQVMETSDGLAFIGRDPGHDHVYVVSGDSGHGLTHGTIAGLLLRDLIQQRENPWRELYDPGRVRLAAAGALVRENLTVARDMLAWITPGAVASVAEIPRGEGAVLREGVVKIAAYRDDDGTLHRRSAVCPHLGCIVAWNGVERSWDCPCHGSRFDCLGHVRDGPANRDLAPVD